MTVFDSDVVPALVEYACINRPLLIGLTKCERANLSIESHLRMESVKASGRAYSRGGCEESRALTATISVQALFHFPICNSVSTSQVPFTT